MSKRLYASAAEAKAAYRRRKREREARLHQHQAQFPAPTSVPVRSVDLRAELRKLAEQCSRGCNRLRMERQPWTLGAVDASRAFEVLRHVESELNRLAG